MTSSPPPARTPAAPAAPGLAHALGYCGLLPFVAGAAAVWLAAPHAQAHAAMALSAYAAVIASFLGGIHWGIAFGAAAAPPRALLLWGVTPSVAGWGAVLLPPAAGLLVHGSVLLACYVVDRRVYPRHGLAGWLPLRLRLSAVAGAACFVGAAGS